MPHVCFSLAYFVHAQIFSLCTCTCVSECLCRHVWACGGWRFAADFFSCFPPFLFLSFFFLFVQWPSLNLKLAVWTRLVEQWAPGIPLTLIFSTGIVDTHHLPDFYLVLGLELGSKCLYSEHFTGWALSLVPHMHVCLRVMFVIPPLQGAWLKILLLGSRETPQHQPKQLLL